MCDREDNNQLLSSSEDKLVSIKLLKKGKRKPSRDMIEAESVGRVSHLLRGGRGQQRPTEGLPLVRGEVHDPRGSLQRKEEDTMLSEQPTTCG